MGAGGDQPRRASDRYRGRPEAWRLGSRLPNASTILRDAGAPGVWGPNRFFWEPRACLDDVCVDVAGHGLTRFYYSSRKVLVYVSAGGHGAEPAFFLARPGPVWGGNE